MAWHKTAIRVRCPSAGEVWTCGPALNWPQVHTVALRPRKDTLRVGATHARTAISAPDNSGGAGL